MASRLLVVLLVVCAALTAAASEAQAQPIAIVGGRVHPVSGPAIEGGTVMHRARVVTEEIGIGLATGLLLTGCAALMLRITGQYGWMSAH